MTKEEHKKDGYITLKEASERFGYSPDYIGQLIRKGKLEGKQVYANVAWMTTAEAIEEYLAKDKRTNKGEKEMSAWSPEKIVSRLLDKDKNKIVTRLLYGIILLLLPLLLAVFYFLSVAFDHHLEDRAKARLIESTSTMSQRIERTSTSSSVMLQRELLLSSRVI